MSAVYLGIDVGQSGAVVVLDEDARCVFQSSFKGRLHVRRSTLDVLGDRVAQLFGEIDDAVGGGVVKRAALELQWVRAGERGGGVQLIQQGALLTALTLHGWEGELWEAAWWRKASGTSRSDRGRNKAASIAQVQGALPTVNLLRTPLCSVPDDGIADAAVIARLRLVRALKGAS